MALSFIESFEEEFLYAGQMSYDTDVSSVLSFLEESVFELDFKSEDIFKPNFCGDNILHFLAQDDEYLPAILYILNLNDNHLTICKMSFINIQNNYGLTPIWLASAYGSYKIVKTLKSFNADINLPNNIGRTPLYAASANDRLSIVKFLLKHGADLNTADKEGTTPLQIAEKNHRDKIAEYLINYQDLPPY